jgi:hypothetical protein
MIPRIPSGYWCYEMIPRLTLTFLIKTFSISACVPSASVVFGIWSCASSSRVVSRYLKSLLTLEISMTSNHAVFQIIPSSNQTQSPLGQIPLLSSCLRFKFQIAKGRDLSTIFVTVQQFSENKWNQCIAGNKQFLVQVIICCCCSAADAAYTADSVPNSNRGPEVGRAGARG